MPIGLWALSVHHLSQVFRVSRVGVVSKKIPGDFRMIHDLSYPKGKSVNDGISEEHSSVIMLI